MWAIEKIRREETTAERIARFQSILKQYGERQPVNLLLDFDL